MKDPVGLAVSGKVKLRGEVGGDDEGDGVIDGPPVVQGSLFPRGSLAVPRKTVYQLSVGG